MTGESRMGRPPTVSYSLQLTLFETKGKDTEMGRVITYLKQLEETKGKAYVGTLLRAITTKSIVDAFNSGAINDLPIPNHLSTVPNGGSLQMSSQGQPEPSRVEMSADSIADQFGEDVVIG